MCGIAGILSIDRTYILSNSLQRMTDSLIHRGPDGFGHWISSDNRIALGHRRLSILDLSDAGKQPMEYLDRYVITFNGEIYNYIELKQQLISNGYFFKSDSDTEVLLALYDQKKEACLELLDGMFAFVIWDKLTKTFFCARDRFGEKPFFFFHDKEKFIFASEIKAFWALGIRKENNEKMIYNYLFYNSLFNPEDLSETFYENIKSIKPAHYLILSFDNQIIKYKRYWDIDLDIQNKDITFEESISLFQEIFNSSINLRLRSDVPVGSSLSGGLDSSAIVASINNLNISNLKQKTFSAKFPGFSKDESKYIDIVTSVIRGESFDCYPNEDSFNSNIEKIIYHQDEPFGSASIAAQFEVMKLARENNTIVVIDGQGADEILCGYHGLVDSFFYELKSKSNAEYKKQVGVYKKIQSGNIINNLDRRLRNQKIKFSLGNDNINNLLVLKARFSEYLQPSVNREFFNDCKKYKYNTKFIFNNLNESLYYATMKGGLQELLRYSDRNSMANSVEVRLPFLSHKLVEFLFSLPSNFKFNNGFTKYLLRIAVDNLLPEEIIWRKDKIGYMPPQARWLKNYSYTNNNSKYISNPNNFKQNNWSLLMMEKYKF